MATDTPVQERSVPKPVFTDAEAGAKEFPSSTSRSYNYFEPRKRRASVSVQDAGATYPLEDVLEETRATSELVKELVPPPNAISVSTDPAILFRIEGSWDAPSEYETAAA